MPHSREVVQVRRGLFAEVSKNRLFFHTGHSGHSGHLSSNLASLMASMVKVELPKDLRRPTLKRACFCNMAKWAKMPSPWGKMA